MKKKIADERFSAQQLFEIAPERKLEVAVHEVGHFALAAAQGCLPHYIAIGTSDRVPDGLLGVVGGGGSDVPSVSRAKYHGTKRMADEWAEQSIATLIAGYVAEARHTSFPFDDMIHGGTDGDDGDLVGAFAWAAWAKRKRNYVLANWHEHGADVHDLVFDVAARVDRYLASHWVDVMRMSKVLALRGELSERSIYTWVKRFGSWSKFTEVRHGS